MVNIWQNLQEELQLNIVSYLSEIDLIILCYVSKYFRTLVFKKCYKYYDISTGFCAIKHWTNRIEEKVFGLTPSIHNIHEASDFEEIYDKLI